MVIILVYVCIHETTLSSVYEPMQQFYFHEELQIVVRRLDFT